PVLGTGGCATARVGRRVLAGLGRWAVAERGRARGGCGCARRVPGCVSGARPLLSPGGRGVSPSAEISVSWLIRVARLLREEGLDASSAHVIEAVRLSETLAALRERPLPGLPELNEATQAVLCAGNDLPLRLIHEKL